MQWEWIAVLYFSYLATVAVAVGSFAKARTAALAGAAACIGAIAVSRAVGVADSPAFLVFVPLLVLLAGYWTSGAFFVSPMTALERWLMAGDDGLLRNPGILSAYAAGPRAVHEVTEAAYLLVYLVIPAGVVTLMAGGHDEQVPRFWATVLLAEFVSYGMLPWLQTRPPRAVEPDHALKHPSSALRRFNAGILNRGSIQVNTVPSGHAAGAVATALAVADVMPAAGGVFLVLAAAIVAATVLGRYHYLADSLLGSLVALTAWYLVR